MPLCLTPYRPHPALCLNFSQSAGSVCVEQAGVMFLSLLKGNIWSLIMNKDQVKGVIKDVAGKVQEIAGKMDDNKGQQIKGLNKQISGKSEKIYGDAREVVKDAHKHS